MSRQSPVLYPPGGAPAATRAPCPPAPCRIGREGLIALGVGAALGLICFAVPTLRFVFSYLTIIIHEMGHALTGWLFGYPSVPAFDFRYGGGVAWHLTRRWYILAAVYGLTVAGAFRHRRNRVTLAVLTAGAGAHAALAFTGAHEVLMLFMGHGMELVLAGVFLYRALSGRSILRGIERPLYAGCGVFMLLCDVRFAYGLIVCPAERFAYQAAKGGGHWMDFSRIAERHLHVPLSAVATFFLACCLIVPAASFLIARYPKFASYVRKFFVYVQNTPKS